MYIMIVKHSRNNSSDLCKHRGANFKHCLLQMFAESIEWYLNVNEAVKAFQKICQMSLM